MGSAWAPSEDSDGEEVENPQESHDHAEKYPVDGFLRTLKKNDQTIRELEATVQERNQKVEELGRELAKREKRMQDVRTGFMKEIHESRNLRRVQDSKVGFWGFGRSFEMGPAILENPRQIRGWKIG